jgi:NADH dehydrogenase/NADH:ubiquinone oxidoreductase subunit G
VPFLVVQASYASPVTEKADVVLPAAIWAEQGGHFVNLEGRVQAAQPGLKAPRGVKTDAAVFQALGDDLGLKLDDNWQAALRSRVSINRLID